jgi:hypothetical protein
MLSMLLPASASAGSGPIAASNLAQGFEDTSFFSGIGTNSPPTLNAAAAQRFTSNLTGQIGSVSFLASEWIHAPGVPLLVSLHDANGQAPGAELASASYQPTGITFEYQLFSLAFDAGTTIVQGSDYYIVFRVDEASPGSSRYRMQLIDPVSPFGTAYQISRDGGTVWRDPSSLGIEIGMEIRLIPAPAAAIMPFAFALVARRRRTTA